MLRCNIVALHNTNSQSEPGEIQMNNALFSKFGKASYAAMKELYEINTRIADQFTDQQFACANFCIESATSQMKLLGEARGYKEIITGQTELVKDLSSRAQGITHNAVDIMNETGNEISTWFDKCVAEACTALPQKIKAS